MPVYQGTHFVQVFTLKSKTTGLPFNISGWTFEADLKDNRDDIASLLNLTTANGGFAVTDAVNGKFEMRITSVQSALLPVARLVFDVLRTDPVPNAPVWLFGGSLKVKRPVTV